jgi:tetratricopeptide (TPR) repeat protein
LASAGRYQHAELIAEEIADFAWQARAFAAIAQALARAGLDQRAEPMAAKALESVRSIPSNSFIYLPDETFADIVEALAWAGECRGAQDAFAQVDVIVRSMTDPIRQALTLAGVTYGLARAGRGQEAEAAAVKAEGFATSIRDEGSAMAVSSVAERVAERLASAGQYQQAEKVARSITDPYWEVRALAYIAKDLARSGYKRRAVVLAEHAESAARSASSRYFPKGRALVAVSVALAEAGQASLAETVARSIPEPDYCVEALAELVKILAKSGDKREALVIAVRAESVARSINNPWVKARALTAIAESVACSGQHGSAVTIANSISVPGSQARALVLVARLLMGVGDLQTARRIAAVACSAGRWSDVAPVVMLADPSAFIVIADMVRPEEAKPRSQS